MAVDPKEKYIRAVEARMRRDERESVRLARYWLRARDYEAAIKALLRALTLASALHERDYARAGAKTEKMGPREWREVIDETRVRLTRDLEARTGKKLPKATGTEGPRVIGSRIVNAGHPTLKQMTARHAKEECEAP